MQTLKLSIHICLCVMIIGFVGGYEADFTTLPIFLIGIMCCVLGMLLNEFIFRFINFKMRYKNGKKRGIN